MDIVGIVHSLNNEVTIPIHSMCGGRKRRKKTYKKKKRRKVYNANHSARRV